MDASAPPGINVATVSEFFARNVPGGDAPLRFELISGGRSNLTYRVDGPERTWVLRRPPLGHILPTAHDMEREYRVLTALNDVDVPSPRTFALCTDPAVNEHPFYVMEFVDGVIVAEQLPAGFAETEEARGRMCSGLVDAMVRLHAVDYPAVGLGDFGRPEGYLERQVRLWVRQWERNKTRELPDVDRVAGRLAEAIPPSPAATIVHGDYRFGNMVLDRDDPGHVLALLDWEMATLGDPLADLGWTFVFYGQPGDPPERVGVQPGLNVTAQAGFWSRERIAAEYERRTGRSTEHVDFYVALGFYKLAVIVEGIWARYVQGQTVGEGYEIYAEECIRYIGLATRVIDESSDALLRGER